MAEYVTKEQVIDWFRPYGHLDKPITFETLVSDLRGMKAADVEPVQEWIPVDDRLPEDNSDVLAYSRIGEESRIYPACYSNGVWFDCVFNAPATDTTTHWMPLPEPPKGGLSMSEEEGET